MLKECGLVAAESSPVTTRSERRFFLTFAAIVQEIVVASEPIPDLSLQSDTIRLRSEKASENMSSKSMIPRLSILIPTLLAVWLATVVALHGPAMIGYVVLHLATTGLFAFGMWKTEQKYSSKVGTSGPSPMLSQPAAESTQSAESDVAIAS